MEDCAACFAELFLASMPHGMHATDTIRANRTLRCSSRMDTPMMDAAYLCSARKPKLGILDVSHPMSFDDMMGDLLAVNNLTRVKDSTSAVRA